jgi:hypothetical protein
MSAAAASALAAASAPLMSWSRQSGAPAVLPRTAPGAAAAAGNVRTLELLLPTAADAAAAMLLPSPTSLPHLRRGASCSAAAARLSACGSPRLLGDVPMLLSEQARWSPAPSPMGTNPGMGTTGMGTTTEAAGAPEARPSWAPASPEESLVSVLARTSATGGAGLIGTTPPCRDESFGADSKFGFEPAERRLCRGYRNGGGASTGVFDMDADSDAD